MNREIYKKRTLRMVTAAMKLKWRLLLGRKTKTNLDSVFKSRHCFVDKSVYNQSYGSSSSHVRMWKLDHAESWAPKNWCFWTVVVKILETPLDSQEIKLFNPKGKQPWIFIGSTVTEAPILWPSGVKRQLIWKRLKAKVEGGSRRWDG